MWRDCPFTEEYVDERSSKCCLVPPDTALMFCYFNNNQFFHSYLQQYTGGSFSPGRAWEISHISSVTHSCGASDVIKSWEAISGRWAVLYHVFFGARNFLSSRKHVEEYWYGNFEASVAKRKQKVFRFFAKQEGTFFCFVGRAFLCKTRFSKQQNNNSISRNRETKTDLGRLFCYFAVSRNENEQFCQKPYTGTVRFLRTTWF